MAGSKRRKYPEGIQPTGSGTYRARIYHNYANHHLGTFKTIGDARAALDIARSEIARNIFVPPAQRRAEARERRKQQQYRTVTESRTIRELVEAWTAWHHRLGTKQGTIYTYVRRLTVHFLPAFGEIPAVDVTSDDITAWYDDLHAEHGHGVSSHVYSTVRALFNYATGQVSGLPADFTPWIKQSPATVIGATRKRHDTREQIVATPQEITSLADRMPAREALAIYLAGWAGLRLGEILALRRHHLTTDTNGVLWIDVQEQVQARGSGPRAETPKSRAGLRAVPVPGNLVAMVTDHLERYAVAGDDGLLFPRRSGANRFHHPNTLRAHFIKARDGLNRDRLQANVDAPPEQRQRILDDFRFHDLRHTALTRIGQAGATLAELKRYAGHSDDAAVAQYQHAERHRLAALAEQLSTTMHQGE